MTKQDFENSVSKCIQALKQTFINLVDNHKITVGEVLSSFHLQNVELIAASGRISEFSAGEMTKVFNEAVNRLGLNKSQLVKDYLA